MKKVLFVASVSTHIISFHRQYLKWFREHGYKTEVASSGKEKIEYCDIHHEIPFKRFPLKISNIRAYKMLKGVIDNGNYNIIHCHTPTASVLTRLVARKKRKRGTKVLYTAHGFHFYKGAPLLNWLIYYPIEKIMAHFTDCLITITSEDYEFAKKHLKAKKIEHINGIGMNTKRFSEEITEKQKNDLKKELEITENDIVLSYVAELNKNKNQFLLIKVMEKLKKKNKNIKLLIVGSGNYMERYKNEVEKRNLQSNVMFLGRRNDVPAILSITDIYVASSLREGLPVNIMEAMYMKLPIVAIDNRGHRELIENSINGYLVKNNVNSFIDKVKKILNDKDLAKEFGKKSYEKSLKYLDTQVLKEMEKIYKEEMKG